MNKKNKLFQSKESEIIQLGLLVLYYGSLVVMPLWLVFLPIILGSIRVTIRAISYLYDKYVLKTKDNEVIEYLLEEAK